MTSEKYPDMPDAELTNFATVAGIGWQIITTALLLSIALGVWRIADNYALVHSEAIKASLKAKQLQAIERETP